MDFNKKILIADDSAFMRKVLRDILEGEGFTQFVECSNGQEAIDKYKSESPDLLLLDIIMPEVDGMEVLQTIGGEAQIIVISAVGQDKMVEEAKSQGAKGYLVKPFDHNDVISKVNAVLG